MKANKIFAFLIISLAMIPFGSTYASYGVQTKTVGCVADKALPDSACTPGAVLTTSTAVICVTGYTKTVRNVPLKVKKQVFAEYGIPYSKHANYEVDHLISLELGGSNDISNLFPESYLIKNGARTKDKFENSLHSQVCKGKINIEVAQAMISSNWLKYYLAPSTSVVTTSVISEQTTPKPSIKAVSWPEGATAKCADNSYYFNISHQGACSRHGGVKQWR